ncbi:MAG: hypothetical protein PVF47_05270 [Anaerolineae bacterium]|jgi:hypothetical protein
MRDEQAGTQMMKRQQREPAIDVVARIGKNDELAGCRSELLGFLAGAFAPKKYKGRTTDRLSDRLLESRGD